MFILRRTVVPRSVPRSRFLTLAALGWLPFCLWQPLLLAQPAGTEGVGVVVMVNDASTKDLALEGVNISVFLPEDDELVAEGVTDATGQWRARLAPGQYRASYRLSSYVPLDTELSIHSENQVITTSLSPMLEAESGVAGHRLRIILNWGSQSDTQVRDADSHLVCACQQNAPHVYYSQKTHEGEGHHAELDVDDMDWGGPETITVFDPVAGRYVYWVHDYSAGPGDLGSSEIVVRVLYDDSFLAERRMPAERLSGTGSRYWRPFAAIEVVPPDNDALIDPAAALPRVVSFTLDEIESGLDFAAPEGYESPDGGSFTLGCFVLGVAVFGFAALIAFLSQRLRRRKRT